MKMRTRRVRAMKSRARVLANTSGTRCRTFAAGCILCACWHHFDMRGFFPRSFEDATMYDKQLTDTFGWDVDDVPWSEAGKYRLQGTV